MRLSILASIVEAKHSDILIHYTSLQLAQQIIDSGYFLLKPGEWHESEFRHSGNNYFLSTARTFSNAYFQDRYDGAYFILDGRKLSTKYKIKPVDFWARRRPLESEDRVLSKSNKIPLWPYVKEIRVFGNPDSLTRRTYFNIRKHKIPIRAFNTANDAALGRKEIPVALTKRSKSYYRPITNNLLALKAIIYLYKYDVDKLAKIAAASDEIYNAIYNWQDPEFSEKEINKDFYRLVEETNLNPYYEKLTAEIVALMRANKVKTFAELVKKKEDLSKAVIKKADLSINAKKGGVNAP